MSHNSIWSTGSKTSSIRIKAQRSCTLLQFQQFQSLIFHEIVQEIKNLRHRDIRAREWFNFVETVLKQCSDYVTTTLFITIPRIATQRRRIQISPNPLNGECKASFGLFVITCRKHNTHIVRSKFTTVRVWNARGAKQAFKKLPRSCKHSTESHRSHGQSMKSNWLWNVVKLCLEIYVTLHITLFLQVSEINKCSTISSLPSFALWNICFRFYELWESYRHKRSYKLIRSITSIN